MVLGWIQLKWGLVAQETRSLCYLTYIVSHVTSDSFPLFTDHKVVYIHVNYKFNQKLQKKWYHFLKKRLNLCIKMFNLSRSIKFLQRWEKTLKQKNICPFLDPVSGKLNPDPEFSAVCLSKQYSSVFTQLRPEWTIENRQEFFSLDMNNSGKTFLSDFEFTDSDIEFACIELSYSASPGPDGIPSSLLKICKKQLKKPLFISWRSSLNKSIIHPDLLLVLISPIHKGGSRVDPGRYRPVALTSHLIKVFERVLRKALVNHLEGFNLIPNSQHGFRAHRSTLIQLLTYWDNVLECLEKGETVDVIYTDFSKAFD